MLFKSIDKTTGESWHTIPGCTYYQVSSIGQVRRDPTKRMRGWGPKRPPGGLLNPCYHDKLDAYLVVRLHTDTGINILKKIHILVCEVFHGDRPDGYLACHKDDNRYNNVCDNLYWGTKKQNAIDRERNRKSGTACLSPSDVRWMREFRFGDRWSVHELAELFQVSTGVVRGVITGKRYQWVTNKWSDNHVV